MIAEARPDRRPRRPKCILPTPEAMAVLLTRKPDRRDTGRLTYRDVRVVSNSYNPPARRVGRVTFDD